jgi:hypothetical protein
VGTSAAREALTKIVQGWPKLWANFMDLIGIFSQNVGPSLAIWANPMQFSLLARHLVRGRVAERLELVAQPARAVHDLRRASIALTTA